MTAMPSTDTVPMTDEHGVYVICSDYCGARIHDTASDHLPDCGAGLPERARLARELSAMQIVRIANEAAERSGTEVAWRCSCQATFDSMDDLAAHHTESGHQGVWTVVDGEEHEGEIAVEVDGKAARLRRGPPREEIPDKPPWRDPAILDVDVYAAQRAIDEAAIALGGMSAGKKCPGKRVIDGVEIACPHITAMRMVRTNICDLEHKHTETLLQVCLIHGILKIGAGIDPAGDGPLFENAAR